MRHALSAVLVAASLLPVLGPSIASAGPVTAGVSLGLAESKVDGQAGADASHTLGVFGRLGFTPRLAGQLELSRIQTGDTNVDIRSGTALLVVDLGSRGQLVPILLAGIGLDRATNAYGGSTDAHHIEGGLGLEYRAQGGVTIAADVRMGGRTLQSQGVAYDNASPPELTCDQAGACGGPSVAYVAPATLQEGEYRSARITIGLRF